MVTSLSRNSYVIQDFGLFQLRSMLEIEQECNKVHWYRSSLR